MHCEVLRDSVLYVSPERLWETSGDCKLWRAGADAATIGLSSQRQGHWFEQWDLCSPVERMLLVHSAVLSLIIILVWMYGSPQASLGGMEA